MRVEQEKVREFHQKYGYPAPTKPEVGEDRTHFLRRKLLEEELYEYVEACTLRDLVAIGDAIADLTYVIVGTAVSHGIDLRPLFEEVHRSNMTKDPAADNPHKPVKGPRFEQPRIAELLLIQQTNLEEAVEKADAGASVLQFRVTHTCIKDDGGTPNRKCQACEREK